MGMPGRCIIRVRHDYRTDRNGNSVHRRRGAINGARQLHRLNDPVADSLLFEIDQILRSERGRDAVGLNMGRNNFLAYAAPSHRRDLGDRHGALHPLARLLFDQSGGASRLLIHCVADDSPRDGPSRGADQSSGDGISRCGANARADSGAREPSGAGKPIAVVRGTAADRSARCQHGQHRQQCE